MRERFGIFLLRDGAFNSENQLTKTRYFLRTEPFFDVEGWVAAGV